MDTDYIINQRSDANECCRNRRIQRQEHNCTYLWQLYPAYSTPLEHLLEHTCFLIGPYSSGMELGAGVNHVGWLQIAQVIVDGPDVVDIVQ